MIDNLTDEVYVDLFCAIEEKFYGVKRLRRYLSKNNEKPFEIKLTNFKKENYSYKKEKLELKKCFPNYLNLAIKITENCEKIQSFCK